MPKGDFYDQTLDELIATAEAAVEENEDDEEAAIVLDLVSAIKTAKAEIIDAFANWDAVTQPTAAGQAAYGAVISALDALIAAEEENLCEQLEPAPQEETSGAEVSVARTAARSVL